MNFTFAEPTALQSEFLMVLLVFGGLAIIITMAFHLSYRNAALALMLKSRVVLALLGMMCVIWYAYTSSYQNFYSLQITDDGFELAFAGPFARHLVVPRRDIVAITYGLPDRGSSKCRITLEDRTSIYHSAWIADKVEICRSYRDLLRRAMAADSSPPL